MLTQRWLGGLSHRKKVAAPTLPIGWALPRGFQISTCCYGDLCYHQSGVCSDTQTRKGTKTQASSPRRHTDTLKFESFIKIFQYLPSLPLYLPPSLPQARSMECDSHRGQGFSGPGGTEGGVPIHGTHEVPHEVGEALLRDTGAHCAHQPQLWRDASCQPTADTRGTLAAPLPCLCALGMGTPGRRCCGQ